MAPPRKFKDIIPEEKIPYFQDFMRRYSASNFNKIKNKLLTFAVFLENHGQKELLDANTEDVILFFKEHLESRDTLKRDTKLKWRNVLNSYFNYVEEYKKKVEKSSFTNPVPSLNLFDFIEKEGSIDELEKAEDVLEDYEVVENILNRLYFTQPRLFIIVSLLLYTGARISEICRIKLKHIDYNERYFYVKIKSKQYTKRWGVYFFPAFFVLYLNDWIEQVRIEYPESEYLFPSSKTNHITTKLPREQLRVLKNELGLKCKINPHAFRDFINTERFDKDLNKKYRCLLLNQTPKGVNVRNYLKKYKKRKKLLEIYDTTLPFPAFKPNLKLI